MERLYDDVKQLLHKEIDGIVKKGSLTPQELESLYKAVDVLKDLCEIKEKESMEDTGYSGRMPWTYDDRYYDIHSYKGANGGYGSNGYSMRRDQTGRYSREGAKEHMIDGLYSMMGDAQNEAERGAIQDCINRLKS